MTDDDLIEAIREAAGYALHREAARRVLDVIRPKGWCVVPEEPTDEMALAGNKARHGSFTSVTVDTYHAMLFSAPPPPLPRKTDNDPLRETF